MSTVLWVLGILALVYVLDWIGVWLWLLDRAMRRVGTPVTNSYDYLTIVRRSARLCRLISKLPSAVEPVAITIGRTVFLNEGTTVSKVLVQHESVHVAQWKRYGVIRFIAIYVYQNLRYGYDNNALEREAEAAEVHE